MTANGGTGEALVGFVLRILSGSLGLFVGEGAIWRWEWGFLGLFGAGALRGERREREKGKEEVWIDERDSSIGLRGFVLPGVR